MRLKKFLFPLFFILILLAIVPYWSEKLLGSAPTKEFKAPPLKKEVAAGNDSQTVKLLEQINNEPDNLDLRRQVVEQLEALFLQSGDAQLQMDEIDHLSVILKKIPDDPQANLKLAEISFNAQVFDKAVERYQLYLSRKPEDSYARLRLASAKIFSGKFAEAQADLDLVLIQDPKNFSALAYKAIAYSQLGEVEQAKIFGSKALEVAPDNEGKLRFEKFLASLSGEKKNLSWEDKLYNQIRANPVAGSKFVKLEVVGSILKLEFKDFPVEQMPDFAREKFLSGILVLVNTEQISSIELLDTDTKKVMLAREINAQKSAN